MRVKMGWLSPIALWLVAVTMPHVAQAQVRKTTFMVGTVEFQATLPEGFCVPEGKAVDAVQMQAAGDPMAVIDLALYPCGDDGTSQRYYIIKTPRPYVLNPMTRDAVLAELRTVVENPPPNLSETSNSYAREGMENIGARGVNIRSSLAFTRVDALCGYISGTVTIQRSGSPSETSGTSGCMTAIGDRVMTIYYMEPGEEFGDGSQSSSRVRSLAETITPIPHNK